MAAKVLPVGQRHGMGVGWGGGVGWGRVGVVGDTLCACCSAGGRPVIVAATRPVTKCPRCS